MQEKTLIKSTHRSKISLVKVWVFFFFFFLDILSISALDSRWLLNYPIIEKYSRWKKKKEKKAMLLAGAEYDLTLLSLNEKNLGVGSPTANHLYGFLSLF